eukprot:GEMP01028864.1.p1 GENE.GEMP01028864.1~~GEMP01028864.1.p1  ORF type:complete len:643 (+),score=148.21 GEMP01028864.1:92-2020(+)
MAAVETPTAALRARTKEPEVEHAEFELRIRKFILELMEPTIHKSSALEQEFKNLNDNMLELKKKVSDLSHVSIRAEQHVQTVEGFRQELCRWDAERQTSEMKITEDMTCLKQELQALRYGGDRRESSINSVTRSLDRMQEEVKGTHASMMEIQGTQTSSHISTSQMIQKTQTEFEVKFLGLETKLVQIGDDLWGGETGLAKVQADTQRVQEQVERCENELKEIARVKANSDTLSRLQTDVFETIRSTQISIASVRENVGNVVNDVKEHFRTATNTIAAHNAQILTDTRKQYQEELAKYTELRNDARTFMEASKESVNALAKSQASSHKDTELMIDTFRENMDNINKKRKADKADIGTESKQLKKRIGGIFETSEMTFRAVEHISNVLGTMMEVCNVAGALDSQDDLDRQGVALMGFKDKDSKEGAGARKRGQSGPKQRTPGMVVTVDNRCLSCSGQSSQVLAGFKLACLQYRPSPVEYKSRTWDRGDLLDYRCQMLLEAKEQLLEGPISRMRNSDITGTSGGPTPSSPEFEGTGWKKMPPWPPQAPNPKDTFKTPRNPMDTWTPATTVPALTRPGTSDTLTNPPTRDLGHRPHTRARQTTEPMTEGGLLDLEDIERMRPHTQDGVIHPRSGRKSFRATNKFR